MQTHVDLQSYRSLMRMHWPSFELLATPVSEKLLCKARTCILYGSYTCCNFQSPICCIIAKAWGKSRLVGGSHTISAPSTDCWILSSCSEGGSYGRKCSITSASTCEAHNENKEFVDLTHCHVESSRFYGAYTAVYNFSGATTAVEILAREKANRKILTFCGDLDKILGGGIATGQITELCMPFPCSLCLLPGLCLCS